MSHLPVRIWHEASICCLDSIHPKCRLGAELLQGSISKYKVISIWMTLNILSETPHLPVLVSCQKNSSPTRQSPVLVPDSNQPSTSSATLFYAIQRLRWSKTTPWSWTPPNTSSGSLKSLTFEGIPQFYRLSWSLVIRGICVDGCPAKPDRDRS